MVTCAIHTTDSVPVGMELVEDNAASALPVTTTFLIVNVSKGKVQNVLVHHD